MAVIENPPSDLITVSSHRGLHALIDGANPLVPENSLQAIGLAAQAGLEMIELDIKLTSDGLPIMSHDQTWGRETCSPYNAQGAFSPFLAQGSSTYNDFINVPVNSMTRITALNTLTLRDTVSVINANGGDSSCEADYQNGKPTINPSSLEEVLAFLTANKIAMVLALDLRDGPAAQAAWKVIAATPDYLGNSYAKSTLFKIPGKAFLNPSNPGVFTDTTVFQNTFLPVSFTNPNTGVTTALGYSDVNFQPVYNTGDIANNLYSNESNIITQIKAFEANSAIDVIAVEVQFKEPGGILSNVLSAARQNWATGGLESVSVFSPYLDYTYPSDATQTPLYFTTTGYCCVPLSAFYYGPTMANSNGPNSPNPAIPFPTVPNPNYTQGQPTDTADERGNLSFVVSQGYNSVTRDDAAQFVQLLAVAGDRNISYMQTGGPNPNCQPGIGQFPGCEADGLTTYTLCANNGGTCGPFTGDRNVAYGANGIYTTLTFTNTVPCIAGSFPGTTPGAGNSCYISPPISYVPPANPDQPNADRQGYPVYCADENGTCNFNGLQSLLFGVYPYWAANHEYSSAFFPYVSSGSYQCALSSFSANPAIGYVKACFYIAKQQFPQPAPTGYGYCGTEGQTCQVQGPARIKYISNGEFTTQVVNGPTPCTNASFGDPNPHHTKTCWVEATTPASGSTGTEVGGSSGPGGTLPCDLYASGGTPCVAAHSTVRSLFGSYGGRLYQVQRTSDNTTTDIGVLSSNGYANAAAQDSFCVGTTCTITKIYDQTGSGNDLGIEGAGGTVRTNDSGASANALPVMLNGNKVYGVSVTSGVGYRNNATHNVATKGAPEGMYMVTSGTNVNGGCCFDYGNAEISSNDTGNGHMDALNFGTFCGFPPCSGSGPWVQADMENGQYMGNRSNPNDQSISSNFVTAMLKNNGQSTFALKAGNAQSGGLTTEYSGSLPTGFNPSYIPMQQEGAIVLGTGGDNSDWGVGSFFEGVMTAGYPQDATEDAVQANIVAAGYNGSSNPTNGELGSYTGPSDPNGPGPQDGFAPTAGEQQYDNMGSKPSLAAFKESLYAAFQSNDSRHWLFVTSSFSGSNFTPATGYANVLLGSAPSLAVFNNQLYVAFQANDGSHSLQVTSSPDGKTFPSATGHPYINMGSAPAMTVFNDKLWVAFQANDSDHYLFLASSFDGKNFPPASRVTNIQIGSAPAVAVFNGLLYVAFRSNDAANGVWIASTRDGIHFSSKALPNQHMGPHSSPALVVSNNVLYYIYGADDLGNEMMVTASTDGSNFQGPKAYLADNMGAEGPAAASFLNGVTVGFQSNDTRNVLFVTNKVTEAGAYTGPSDPGGPGPQDNFTTPSVEQPNVIMGSKPAMISFNSKIYAAFQSNDATHLLYVASTEIGSPYATATGYTNIAPGSAPAMTVFNRRIYMAFQANDVSHWLFVTSSSDGSSFSAPTSYPNISIGSAPAMVEFNNKLYIAFQGDDPNHYLFVTSSTDGSTFLPASLIPKIQIGSAPAMAVLNGELYIAFRANDSSNDVWIASSSDGVNFSSYSLPGQQMGWRSSPALVAYGNALYCIYGANDLGNEMLVTVTTDGGSTWQGPKAYPAIQMGPVGPGATAYADYKGAQVGITVGFQSNDSRNILFTTTDTAAPTNP